MAIETKVRKIGNSLGIVLPKEALHTMKVQEGSALYLTEGPENTMQMTANTPEFAESMVVVESLMQRYRNTLQELAK